ncbi:MAG: hypothetical protein C0467_07045 [Planctomycetaceae bacterium]|nr:hypothetical protein [Planctomycetaceae bacterium]
MQATLTEAGATALFENPPTTMFIVHGRQKGTRWIELGRAKTRQGALAFITGKGKFWVEERRAEGAKDRE